MINQHAIYVSLMNRFEMQCNVPCIQSILCVYCVQVDRASFAVPSIYSGRLSMTIVVGLTCEQTKSLGPEPPAWQ